MDVFIRNLPDQTTEKGLRKFFKPHLEALSIKTFSCQKVGKYATLTFLKIREGQLFLSKHGQMISGNGYRKAYPGSTQLYLMGFPIYCSLSNKPPDKFQLLSLEKEAKTETPKIIPVIADPMRSSGQRQTIREFDSAYISCGIWSYEGTDLVFTPHLTWNGPGKVKFGARRLSLTKKHQQIDFDYSWIKSLTIEGSSMTITCLYAPRFSETDLTTIMENLQVKNETRGKKRQDWKRLSSLDGQHQRIVSSCLVYSVEISSPLFRDRIRSLKVGSELPPIIYRSTHSSQPTESIVAEYKQLQQAFTESHSALPFPIMFQMQKLAQDAYLPPSTVIEMFPEVSLMARRSGTDITVSAIRKLFHQVEYRGPEAEAHQFNLVTLVKILRDNEERSKRQESYSEETTNTIESEDVANIHRAIVTPAGVYLRGPEPETKNRVLRKYNDHLAFFLRVQFCDENSEQVRYDSRVSSDEIFRNRFKDVLKSGINIAGRNYGFLGFSHSSLRAQTCWFMAPFVERKVLHFYQNVIKDLGDFSHIRSPAKCAARIGQAFSDTPNAIPLGSITVRRMPDVERNGRVFSDGCGTLSQSVSKHIWDALPNKRLLKPVAFQIRFSGAKGMISLDSRIEDHALILRSSMIKFSGSDATDIEICGAAYKPLPMFLNKQIIKILEDLGVPEHYFLKLQADTVEGLRQSTLNTLKAAQFLSAHAIGEVVHLPWFLEKLVSLSLSFHEDAFLRDVVELSVLVELRELKHRARILVPKGATLYGIMDETGILKEGEVFIIMDGKPGETQVITGGNIIITRSPALHPGDVQLVRAVNVPSNSPLRDLSNCVCFSQNGARDLPSQLSGGDLDGDLYNLIWDEDVILRRLSCPADYPRQDPVDIGRTVEKEDIIDFFVTFMATDQLGRIATIHQVIADQSDRGTFDPHCLTLANMHSTAVDFSKTGIPVDLKMIPKYNRIRPDFMAPGPHVNIEARGSIDFRESKENTSEEENHDDELQEYRYYESPKVLGKLYRAIDEQEVFRAIHRIGAKHENDYSSTYLMDTVWSFVRKRCGGLNWSHHLEWARDIRDWYNDNILTIMSDYSTHPLRPLSENEVFIGNILGKTGKQSKAQRELSTTMKERFDKDVKFIINNIIKDGAQPSLKALERIAACLEVGMEHSRRKTVIGGRGEKSEVSPDDLVSFKYVVAALALREIDRCSGGKS